MISQLHIIAGGNVFSISRLKKGHDKKRLEAKAGTTDKNRELN
jgi:hypothetical protein